MAVRKQAPDRTAHKVYAPRVRKRQAGSQRFCKPEIRSMWDRTPFEGWFVGSRLCVRGVDDRERRFRRAEDEHEVGRRLFDELQERLRRGFGELACLVEDVDLRVSLDRLEHDSLVNLRMSSIPRWDATSISTTSSEFPFAIARHTGQVLSGLGDGPGVPAQLSAFARIRAIDVLPVPRGPANR